MLRLDFVERQSRLFSNQTYWMSEVRHIFGVHPPSWMFDLCRTPLHQTPWEEKMALGTDLGAASSVRRAAEFTLSWPQCQNWRLITKNCTMFLMMKINSLLLNKTKYFRLRRYDEVLLLSFSLNAVWVFWVLSECLLNALWFMIHPEVILKTSWRCPEDNL